MVDFIADTSYDLENTLEYNLSIQVSLDGFSFIITDPNSRNLIALKNDPLKISNEKFIARRIAEWIDTQELLKKSFRQVQILFCTNYFTLIPESLYSEEKNNEIFNQLFGKVNNLVVKANTFPGIDSKLLFGIQNDLDAELKNRFNKFSYLHPIDLLLHNLPETNDSPEVNMLLFLSSESLYILILKGKNLLIANSYKYFHFNDMLYFILSNLQQCGIDVDKTRLFLTDNLNNDVQNDIITSLKKYLGSVQLLKTTMNFNPEIFDISQLQHVLLLLG